jgi:hypothetical protein
MNWSTLKPLFRKLLLPILAVVATVAIVIIASGKTALSQQTLIAQASAISAQEGSAIDADIPANLEQGYQDRPNYGYSPYAGGREFPQRVFWGDTHLHTSYSFDAGAAGARLGPEDAYRFARGEEMTSSSGQQVRLSRPLDFLVVSDHSDGLGGFTKLLEGTPEILANPTTKAWHEAVNEGGRAAAAAVAEITSSFAQGTAPQEALPTQAEFQDYWGREIDAAEKYNTPGLFTAFIGYEWTSLVTGDNLHRNVIFRDNADKAKQVLPKTTVDSQDPETLWAWMQNYEDKTGGKVLAIPHNGNLSSGRMFADTTLSGQPLTDDYAKRRQLWEPIYETTQTKGDGETHPFLSPNDEFADFETWDKGNLDLTTLNDNAMLPHEYTRSALKLGLGFEQKLGTNPFKYGLIGSTDSHISLSAVEENNMFSKYVTEEPHPGRTTEMIKASPVDPNVKLFGWEVQAAGFAGVWARENTREALWDAMKRREVYASTGPRITVRLFGGWDFTPVDIGRNLGDVGYTKGVPMGGDLKNAPQGKSPSFLVAALKDPIRGNLDRIQIVKGWLDSNGETQEQVYDVVWSGDRKPGANGKVPAVGNTVNTATAEWTNTIGAVELATAWTDPDFDPSQRAFYYARVLEIPTPRWTNYDQVRFNETMPPEVPLTLQERCYTSPIWYSPA